MSEKPILFSGPMVRAILEGRKTMTRRIVKDQRLDDVADVLRRASPKRRARYEFMWAEPDHEVSLKPYAVPGDTLWVRETIRRGPTLEDSRIEYRDTAEYVADGAPTKLDTWPWQRTTLPAIHCPRGLSRLSLRVTAVRVERLQEISETDALAEGIVAGRLASGQAFSPRASYGLAGAPFSPSARGAFEDLWDTINGKRAPWASNPWVWVVSFERMEQPR